MTTIAVRSRAARIAIALLLAMLHGVAFASAVGFTAGESSVDPTGAANYRIPLAMPPGAGGLQPELALLYHSRAGNGHLGVGWSLEGLSAVTRCPAAWEPDGYSDSVRLEATDRFCLDGQKLLTVSGTYGASGTEYRTEIESFRRVVSYGSAGTGPARFQVHTNAGLIIEYGDTTNSRVVANAAGTALLWGVRRIADLNGNAIEFEYGKSATTSEHWISQIRYSGQAAITIDFNYSTRSDVTSGFLVGSATGLSQRLQNIEVNYSGSLVRRYDLAYVTGDRSGRSLLASVTECTASICLPPTTFDWQGGYRQFMSTARQVATHDLAALRIADMNSDGWPDMVYWRADRWRLRLGPQFDVEIEGPVCDDEDGLCTDSLANAVTYRSLNGRDVIYAPSHSSYYERLAYDGSTFGKFSTGIPREGFEHAATADLNGDGYDELITVPAGTGGEPLFTVFMGQPQGVVASGSSYQYAGAGATYGATPFPLDGRPGFLYSGADGYVSPQEGGPGPIGQLQWMTLGPGGLQSQPVTDSDWFSNPLYDVDPTYQKVADVNGDGLPDLLYLQDDDPMMPDEYWRVLINNGLGFDEPRITSLWRGTTTAIHPIDWMGDGRGVIAVPRKDQGEWQYWIWTGQDFSLLETTSDLSTMQDLQGLHFLDLNRDGVTDRMYATSGNWYVRFGVPVLNDLLVGVTVGEGPLDLDTRFTYVTLANPKFYSPGPAYSQNGYERAVGTMAVVAHVASETGMSALGTDDDYVYTSYLYANGRVHRSGRGFAGFERVTAVNENSMTRTVNEHLFEFPYTGMLESTEQRMITSHTLNTDTFVGYTGGSPRYLMLGTCLEPGVELGPGLCDLEPPPPDDPPLPPYIDQAEFTVGNLVSTSSNTYTTGPVAGAPAGIHYPRVDTTTESRYDLATETKLRETLTSFAYDTFGNPTTITATTTNGSGGDLHRVATTNTYSNDTASWCLGRVINASVVHEAPGTPSLTRSSNFSYLNCQLATESVDDAPALSTTYQHDGFGNRVRISVTGSGATRTTETNYGLAGTFPVAMTNALGHTETRAWDGRFGVMTSQTGPNRLSTNWTYDAFGRRLTETPPAPGGGTQRQTRWDRAWCGTPSTCRHPAARIAVTTRTDAVLGGTDDATRTELDAHGREVTTASRTFSGGWVYEYTEYDALGRVARKSLPTAEASSTSASVLWIDYQYDQLGRVIQESRPRLNDVTEYTYEGLLTRTVHLPNVAESRRESTRVVNVMDRLVAYIDVTSGGPLTTSYGYDAVGNTTAVTDAENHTTTMGYDARGNKTSMSAPEMGNWSYLHNAFGELTQQTDARGSVVTQQYDALGRIVERIDADGTTIWTYDHSFGAGVGKPATVETDGVDSYWEGYAYDSLGQLTDTFTEVDSEIHWTSTDYDDFGRVLQVMYPDIIVDAVSGGGPPATPANLAATPAVSDDGAFSVSWDPVSGPVIRYQLHEERIGDPAGWQNAYYGTALSVLLPGRTDGESYRYRVRACGTECGAWSSASSTVSVVMAPGMPGIPAPSVSITSTGSFTVEWDPSPGPNFAGYKLERRQDSGAWQAVTLADPMATSHAESIAPVPELHGYTYRVLAHNANGAESDWVEGYPVSVQGPPGLPASITVPAQTTTGFDVDWTNAAGTVDRYELYRATVSDFSDETMVYSGGAYEHTDAPSDGTYWYRVRACNDVAGCGQPRSSGAVEKQTPPTPPYNFVPLQSTFYNASVSLSWQVSSSPDRYEVFRTTNGQEPGSSETPVYSGTATQIADSAPNGTYSYYIRACISFACSGFVQNLNGWVTVLHSPSTPPSITVPSQVTNGTVSVSWGSSSGTYELYEATNSSFSGQTQVYSGTGTSKQLSRGAGTYYYRVRACNDAGCSSYRTGSNPAQVIVAPGQPSSISVPSGYVTNGSVAVSWGSAANSPTSYNLYEATNSSFSGQTLVYSGMNLSKTVTGRANGTYYYRVRACNAAGCGSYRASGGVTVLHPPANVTGFNISPTTSTEGWYNMTWNAASGATYYEVANYGNVSGTYAQGTQFANGTYSHRVRACNAAACSTWSPWKSVTVQMCSWGCEPE